MNILRSGNLYVCVIALMPFSAMAQTPWHGVPKVEEKMTGVKARTRFNTSYIRNYYGVVEKIDGRSVTLMGKRSWEEKPTSHTFEAIDVLADGGLHDQANGATAYLWSDMKKGDTVRLGILTDDEEKKPYCAEVCIDRRPGGKIPESQRPKEDVRRWREVNVLNDIENGLDVEDEEIAAAFPIRRADPEGLPAKWREMLDAIREKAKKEKDKDLKATPPEKK